MAPVAEAPAAGVADQGAGGGFYVANPKGPWFSFTLSSLVTFLESYGWLLLASVVATSFLLPSFKR